MEKVTKKSVPAVIYKKYVPAVLYTLPVNSALIAP
jgi:hypothetical protein